jgi:capsular polysaccharide export protein
MPRRHLASAIPTLGASRPDGQPRSIGSDTLAALFPEARSIRAIWSGSHDCAHIESRVGTPRTPCVVFGHGLLRSPPRTKGTPALLSAVALAATDSFRLGNALLPGRLLETRGWETPALLDRAAAARAELTARRVGGSWWQSSALPKVEEASLVVADQATSETCWQRMLAVALAENEAAAIVLLAPGSQASRKPVEAAAARGCAVVTTPVDPWAAIERASRVYAAGGEAGFLALLAGREVHCFADSVYSGWGLTIDDGAVRQRPFRRSLDEIFAGVCLVATRCLDPYRKRPVPFEEVTSILADWRRVETANRRIAVCVGMSFWKRRHIAEFLRSGEGPPAFRRSAESAVRAARARPGGAIAFWASRAPTGLARAAAARGIALVRVEDGFLRSVGLGSDFTPTASLVLDEQGMHYDPRTRSDLERLLGETDFDPSLVERAHRLIVRIVARGITKYNLSGSPLLLDLPSCRRRVLVPGQVEDDLSVRLGGGEIRGNLDLLARVRAANPDAFILYKPHPDIEAGHRRGAIPDRLARQFADVVVRDVSTARLLVETDELHTLTSLAGFEALLRRRRVVVHGRPFYAGWGLTTDLAPIDRGRRLTLEELVAGALILYPRYLDPATGLPCTPEIVIERLADPALWRAGPLVILRRLQGALGRRRALPSRSAAERRWRHIDVPM